MKRTIPLVLLLGACGSDPAPDCSSVAAENVPSARDAIFAYLDCRGYESLAAESRLHPATSAHSSMRRVFINDLLERSLSSGAAEHPVGAAAVKEIYRADGTLRGWAAMVKVEAGSTGDSWYWYENYSTTSGSSPVAAGVGARICTGCHSEGGRDYFLTPFPLE